MIWDFISGKRRGPTIEVRVREELLCCCMVFCLFHTHLGAGISTITTASDASSTGGAVGISTTLTAAGKSFVKVDKTGYGSIPQIPVLVLSLFNGIGGAFRAYDLCGVSPVALISYDIPREANRVTSRRWPHAVIEADARQYSENEGMALQISYCYMYSCMGWLPLCGPLTSKIRSAKP